MKTEFVLYSGLRTIGGVNASVTYGKDRVIFEFGSAYDPKTDVFCGAVEKREKNGIRDMLRLGLLPRVDGVYRKEDLGDEIGLAPAEDSPFNTAVFITHLHLDHMAYIGAVAPQIPIYMHKNAQLIERALEATGEGAATMAREFTDLEPDVTVRVGEIEVYPMLTRSDSYCDFAFFITTPDGTFHWTGDLALHWEEKELTIRQMNYAKQKGVDVLLCDSTSFMDGVMRLMYNSMDASAIKPDARLPEGMLDEAGYHDGLFASMESVTGLCVFNYYQREMSTAMMFIDWAERCGRVCVFEPDAAYIVYKFFGIKPYVFIPDSHRYPGDTRYQSDWFRELLSHCHVITRDDIYRQPEGYLLQNSYRHIMELLDLPGESGVYLHADGIPIGDFDPAYANMRKIVDRTDFAYVTFFCENYFGHGYPGQVKYFVDEINPRVLIPCHGFNPERLLPKDGRQLLPKLNRSYALVDHDLVPLD